MILVFHKIYDTRGGLSHALSLTIHMQFRNNTVEMRKTTINIRDMDIIIECVFALYSHCNGLCK